LINSSYQLSLITLYLTPGYLEDLIPKEIGVRHYIIITLPKAIQLEFGRGPLSAFQKTGRVATAVAKATRSQKTAAANIEKIVLHKAVKAGKAKKTGKKVAPAWKAPARKTTTKRKVVELEGDNTSDILEESEVIYIREAVPVVKRNNRRLAKKTKN
jgi:hypothetical protein